MSIMNSRSPRLIPLSVLMTCSEMLEVYGCPPRIPAARV